MGDLCSRNCCNLGSRYKRGRGCNKDGIGHVKVSVKKAASTATGVLKQTSISELLPYAPRNQVALAGNVPYIAVNGEGLKEKLISMVKVGMEINGTGKGAPASNLRLKSTKLSSKKI